MYKQCQVIIKLAFSTHNHCSPPSPTLLFALLYLYSLYTLTGSWAVTNFIWSYLHHGLKASLKPLEDLSIDTSHASKQSIMAEILGRSTGNHHGTVY